MVRGEVPDKIAFGEMGAGGLWSIAPIIIASTAQSIKNDAGI
jgi:hypothetical protein